MYSLRIRLSLALLCSGIMMPRPFRTSHTCTEAGTGDKTSGCWLCKLGTHLLPIASRPLSCQSPAKEQAQSGLKNHFAIFRLVAISTAETGSTCSKLKQVKKQHKATKLRVEHLKLPNHIQSLLTFCFSTEISVMAHLLIRIPP